MASIEDVDQLEPYLQELRPGGNLRRVEEFLRAVVPSLLESAKDAESGLADAKKALGSALYAEEREERRAREAEKKAAGLEIKVERLEVELAQARAEIRRLKGTRDG